MKVTAEQIAKRAAGSEMVVRELAAGTWWQIDAWGAKRCSICTKRAGNCIPLCPARMSRELVAEWDAEKKAARDSGVAVQ